MTYRSRSGRWLLTASLTAFGVLPLGCRQILGLDKYSARAQREKDASAAPRDASPRLGDAGTLFDPKPPYLTGEACETCMTENCATENAACNADTGCTAWRADAVARPDAVSAFARFSHTNSLLWNAEHENDGGPVALPEADVRKCARDRCTPECELGRDFSCFGNFEWPRSFPSETDIRSRIVNPVDIWEGWPNFDVRACLDPICNPPFGHAMTDAQGFVELAIRQRMTGLSGSYAEFNGFFLVEGGPTLMDGGPAFYPEIIESSRPWISGDYGYWGNVPIALYTPYFTLLGTTYDPTQAYYEFQPLDCRNNPAKGVTVEIHVFDGNAFQACDACSRIIYSDDHGLPDPTLTAFSSLGQVAYVSGPVRQSIAVVRDEKSRRAVAALSLYTVAGDFHIVEIWPPSIAQLAAFPKGTL